ncbi:hypothetical protein FHETE_5340 [Fusarium heterosporum]|uniref:Uncharacterized protein n=1 Tax=Fusarium heterosporum TaxID=42747 RepID=A0A8H5WS45_FUSHE|nr:hypothetical protein FHETE_5340 [Fusarium heterosporum]
MANNASEPEDPKDHDPFPFRLASEMEMDEREGSIPPDHSGFAGSGNTNNDQQLSRNSTFHDFTSSGNTVPHVSGGLRGVQGNAQSPYKPNMATKDIRDDFDLTTGEGLQVANATLQGCPPLSKHKASGLDCLIVVLRRIYSHCLDPDALAYLKFPDENPILRYAWRRFGDGPDEVSEADVEREQVCNELNKTPVHYTAPFKSLCCSELMNRTFWSQDVFRLIDVLNPDTGESVECSSEIAGMSLLDLDHTESPGLSLKDVINNAFGMKPSWGKMVFTPSKPWVVRLSYKSSVQEDKRLKFDDLRRLQLPRWEYDPGNQAFMEIGSIGYVLIAIVRMTDKPKPSTYVRTYAYSGANIVGQSEPVSFMNNSWSVTDPSASYMLFYGLANRKQDPDGPYPYPEVAEAQRVDSEILKAMDEDLFPLIASPPADPSRAFMEHFTFKQRRGPRPGKDWATLHEEENQDSDRQHRRRASQDLGTSSTHEDGSQELGDAPDVGSNKRGKDNNRHGAEASGPKRPQRQKNAIIERAALERQTIKSTRQCEEFASSVEDDNGDEMDDPTQELLCMDDFLDQCSNELEALVLRDKGSRQSQDGSEQRHHLQGELKKAWATEKASLQGSVSYERSLRESKEETLELARSKASTLNKELTEATTKAVNLQQDLMAATAQIKTAEDQVAARVTVPRGVTGDLAKTYLRLTDEFRDIPSVPETIDGLDMATAAIEITPILDQYNAKEYLVAFLNERQQGWHFLSQVLNGCPSVTEHRICSMHGRGCMKVRVGGLMQELEFDNS